MIKWLLTFVLSLVTIQIKFYGGDQVRVFFKVGNKTIVDRVIDLIPD